MKRGMISLAIAAVLPVPALMLVRRDKTTPIAKADTVELCTEGGQVKGSEKRCQADAEKCASCNLAKGAPGPPFKDC